MSIVDWIYPKQCAGCGKEGEYVCQSCAPRILRPPAICPECAKPAAGGWVHPRCRKQNSMERLIVGMTYRGIIQESLKRVKYRNAWDRLGRIYEIWRERVEIDLPELEGKLWVPVPMYERKRKERGFNQAEVLAQMAARDTRGRIELVLRRQRATQAMYGLSKKERQKNVKGVFAADATKIRLVNADLAILIDDVWTTGATMKECTRILKQAGFQQIWGVTMSR